LFNGWTALFFASSEGNVECLQVLLENGCRVHVKDDIGWNALTYALYRGKVKAAELISMYLGKDEDVVMVKQKSEKSEGELDLDDIPSLSLPPPIIPLRIYGHHYLDHKILLQIELGGYENSSNVNSLRLKGSRQYGSYKLKISVKPEREMTFFVNIPLKDKVHVFSSTVESLDAHEIEFELVPSFGTKPIARGVFSNSQCKEFYASQEAVNGKEFFVPLLDWGLVNIGEVSFRTSVVKPFVHDAMSIGGTIETYWKSTTQTSTGDSMHSLVTGSSLAKEFVELTCQTTKDGIVVVYDDWFVRIGSIPIPIYSLTHEQLVTVFQSTSLQIQATNSQDLARELKTQFFTLTEALKVFFTH
jgi:CDK inhibitor PHO81